MDAAETFIFYLFIDFISASFLLCADRMISDDRRRLMQDSRVTCLFSKKFITARHVCFIACFLLLFFVSAVRDHVGTDYNSYANVFVRINTGHISIFDGWLSPGYVLICKFIGLFSPTNYYIMFAVMAFITAWYLLKTIYRMSCDFSMSLYIFMCFCMYYNSFNQFRQVIATVITTYACYFLSRSKVKKFILYVLLATSIHKSAVIMMGMLFVYKFKINMRTLILYLIMCVVINAGYSFLLLRLISMTSYGGYIGSHFSSYMDRSTILNTLVRVTMLAGCLIFSKETIKRNPHNAVLYHCAIICTVLQTIVMRSHIMARITTYFYVPYIILVPEVLKTIEGHFDRISARIVRLSFICFMLVYQYVYYNASYILGYGLYRTFLF